MLKNACINHEIMKAISLCGHGDKILIADGNYGKLGLDENLSDPGRPLLSAEEILALPRDEQILLCLGMKPIRCRKLYQNEIGPWGGELAPNPMEGGALPFRPRIQIRYGRS